MQANSLMGKAPVVDKRLLQAIKAVTAKRARVVLDHILEHGFITTEQLKDYGYNHPPRAARDVREAGIPLKTVRVRGSDGRMIGAYQLGDPADIRNHVLDGRKTLSKDLLEKLYAASEGRCYSCFNKFEKRYLQIDHRIPYEIAGEPSGANDIAAFMLLCGSCQRRKSWSCENCPNWTAKKSGVCKTCYWARPEGYEHLATEPMRRVEVVFRGGEITVYEKLQAQSKKQGRPIADLIKENLQK